MTGKIFFFHNPKAGGSSLRQILEARFPSEDRCPIIENNMVDHEERRGDYARFRGYCLYAGHYGLDIFSAVQSGHLRISNFRHPVTRLLSLYNYFRFGVNLSEEELRTDRYYAVRFAKAVDFKAFVSTDDPRVEVYVRNAHFRQLTNSCWSLTITKQLGEALRLVDQMPWYYVCEYPEISVLWFRRVFDTKLDLMPRINMTGDHGGKATTLGNLDFTACPVIYRKNELDLSLYGHAVDRLLNANFVPGTRLGLAARVRNRLRAFPSLASVISNYSGLQSDCSPRPT